MGSIPRPLSAASPSAQSATPLDYTQLHISARDPFSTPEMGRRARGIAAAAELLASLIQWLVDVNLNRQIQQELASLERAIRANLRSAPRGGGVLIIVHVSSRPTPGGLTDRSFLGAGIIGAGRTPQPLIANYLGGPQLEPVGPSSAWTDRRVFLWVTQ